MSKSIVPTTAPALDAGLIVAIGQEKIVNDPHAFGTKILNDCGTWLVVVRDVVVGRYNDVFALVTEWGARVLQRYGNADPGRTGLNKLLGLDYARLCEGLWVLAPGRHKTQLEAYIQPRVTQAIDLELPEYFHPDDPDERYLGHCAINRMAGPDKPGPRKVGRPGINWHAGSDTKTGSAGCLTNAPAHYAELRDAAYAGMGVKGVKPRQPFLPVVVVRGPL